MATLLLFVGYPVLLGMLFATLDAEDDLRSFWTWAAGVGLGSALIFVVWMGPFDESSPVTSVMWGICPTLLAALTIRLLHRARLRWPWKALVAAGVASISIMPVFMASCIVAEAILRRYGCFF